MQSHCQYYAQIVINLFTDIELEEPRPQLGKKVAKNDDGKYETKCLKLNNNVLSELKGFNDFICKIVMTPTNLSWIDISLNELTKIDSVS